MMQDKCIELLVEAENLLKRNEREAKRLTSELTVVGTDSKLVCQANRQANRQITPDADECNQCPPLLAPHPLLLLL